MFIYCSYSVLVSLNYLTTSNTFHFLKRIFLWRKYLFLKVDISFLNSCSKKFAMKQRKSLKTPHFYTLKQPCYQLQVTPAEVTVFASQSNGIFMRLYLTIAQFSWDILWWKSHRYSKFCKPHKVIELTCCLLNVPLPMSQVSRVVRTWPHLSPSKHLWLWSINHIVSGAIPKVTSFS